MVSTKKKHNLQNVHTCRTMGRQSATFPFHRGHDPGPSGRKSLSVENTTLYTYNDIIYDSNSSYRKVGPFGPSVRKD